VLTGRRIRTRRLVAEEDGSTLLMYPFAVLTVLVIGAIAIDAAVLFQAHRQAVDVAAGLAGDIAGIIDEETFAGDGTVVVDRDRAAAAIAYANDVVLADHPHDLRCRAAVPAGGVAVAVTCEGRGRPLLLPIGGGPDGFAISATSTAAPVERR
jgi:hypothetical protein